METTVYESIDDLGLERIAALEGSPVDFGFDLLRAVERTLWGDVKVRYVAVEAQRTLLGFTPVYFGTNIKFLAPAPGFVGQAYDWAMEHLGTGFGYKVGVAGSLFSDRGWIPTLPGCDQAAVVDALLKQLDVVCREERVSLCFLKDINERFPQIDLLRKGRGFTETHSLPTVYLDTGQASFDDYIQTLSANNRSHARRAIKKAKKLFDIEVYRDFAHLVPEAFVCWRNTYLKANFKLEELRPAFFEACSGMRSPESELHVIREKGRIVGVYLIYWTATQQLNKRVGVDYRSRNSAAIYNIMHYRCVESAIERGIRDSYFGQTTYTPKLRLGGVLEDQFLFIKPYSPMVAAGLPAEKIYMRRFSKQKVLDEIEAQRQAAKAATAAKRAKQKAEKEAKKKAEQEAKKKAKNAQNTSSTDKS